MLIDLPNIITTKPPQPKMNDFYFYFARKNQEKFWRNPNRKFKNRVTKTSNEEWDRCQEILKTIKPNPCNQSIP